MDHYAEKQAYATTSGSAAPGLTEEANSGLRAANELHSLLDDLENRLFGPTPRAVTNEAIDRPSPPPIFANQIRETRQRIESACSRLSLLQGRF